VSGAVYNRAGMKILIAVDGSRYALDAVKLLVEHAEWFRNLPEVELVTVHLPVPAVGRVGKNQLDKYYREEGEEKLAAAKRALAAAKVPFETHILVGPVAESIVKHAKARRCDLIYMGNRGAGAIADAFIGSTASKVLQLSDTPVLLVK
jgi:nucleotide-binding universal stress UspA family protein